MTGEFDPFDEIKVACLSNYRMIFRHLKVEIEDGFG